MVTEFCALGNPAAYQFPLLVAQLAIGPWRRHPDVGILAGYPFPDHAVVRLSGDKNRWLMTKSLAGDIQPQLALASPGIGPVTLETVLREDRTDVAGKVDRVRVLGGCHRCGQQEQQWQKMSRVHGS